MTYDFHPRFRPRFMPKQKVWHVDGDEHTIRTVVTELAPTSYFPAQEGLEGDFVLIAKGYTTEFFAHRREAMDYWLARDFVSDPSELRTDFSMFSFAIIPDWQWDSWMGGNDEEEREILFSDPCRVVFGVEEKGEMVVAVGEFPVVKDHPEDFGYLKSIAMLEGPDNYSYDSSFSYGRLKMKLLELGCKEDERIKECIRSHLGETY